MNSPSIYIRLVIAVFLTFFVSSATGHAEEITEVISTSPSWDTFTNKDGTGLYHEILRKVFGRYGITVHHEYSKSSRSKELVSLQAADMMTCDDMDQPPLVAARYPMYENYYYVFFRKDRIGPWLGPESLRNKEILSQPSYYNQANFPVPVTIKEVSTGVQALAMILLNRSDFYVDDMNFINKSLAENTIPFDKEDFDTQSAGKRSYFPLFNTTERGKAIKKMYEDGIYALHKEGKLKAIYDKWGYAYPEFDRF